MVGDEGPVTVPAVPVEAEIVDGQLEAELFAAGRSSNPDSAVWRVEYRDLEAGDQRFWLASFSFVAEPNRTIDLADVTPVAGRPPVGKVVIPNFPDIEAGPGSLATYNEVGGLTIQPSAVPTSPLDVTPKRYVDQKADKGHEHGVAEIRDLPEISSSTTGSVLVQRLSDGNLAVPDEPHHDNDAVSKAYVDSELLGKVAPETVAAMISQAIADLVGSAPESLDTIYELAAYLLDDEIAGGLVQQLAQKANKQHTHSLEEITDLPEISTAALGGALAQRGLGGQMPVPEVPEASTDAASKSYVDSRGPVIQVVETKPDVPEDGVLYVVWGEE